MLRQLAVSALLASLLHAFGVARGAKPPSGDKGGEIAAIVDQIAADGVYTTQYVGLADDKCYVQSAAARSLTGLAGVPDSKIVDLLKKSDCVASGAGAGLAEQADERALRILRPYLLREGEGHYDTMVTLSRHDTASVRELMQALLSSDHSMVVDLAREYLEASP